MKMEVLSVQNQFQGQFGVLGSEKVKDWTTPLTPPVKTQNSHHHHLHHHHLHNHHHHLHSDTKIIKSQTTIPAVTTPSSATATATTTSSAISATTAVCCVADTTTLHALSTRLQTELRAAKSRHLACTEVLLPADLLHRVAAEMIAMSEKEPCGIRGCSVFIEFEDEPGNSRRIASLQVDHNTVSTFELYLTLKHDRSGWTSILPQFLKNLTRSSTIMISPDFTLTKNKLYRSFSE